MSAQPAKQTLPPALAALRGCRVTRFVIDDSLTLAFAAAGRTASLRIDGAGRLERGAEAQAFSPDAGAAGLAPVLALMNARVASAALAADGSVELAFDGGARLVALPDEHQVSWSAQAAVQGEGEASASCIAEGRVVWE